MTGRISHPDMAEGMRKMATAKSGWLETFSSGAKKRPDHEIETQQKHLQVLEQAAEDYQRAADRPQQARS